MKIIDKIITLITTVIMMLVLVGLVFTSGVRNNLIALSENLYNAGPVGVLLAIWLIWCFYTTTQTLKKLFNAKGFNSKFWKDL
tara:strand:- start:99 stop:347 length:249 start_codon:yes stop_codon:yes gene_type:complete